jgi:hypothetical protein
MSFIIYAKGEIVLYIYDILTLFQMISESQITIKILYSRSKRKTKKGKKKKKIFNVSLDEINRITHNFDNKLDFQDHHHLVNHHHLNYLIDV